MKRPRIAQKPEFSNNTPTWVDYRQLSVKVNQSPSELLREKWDALFTAKPSKALQLN
jgi:hypothetical protein